MLRISDEQDQEIYNQLKSYKNITSYFTRTWDVDHILRLFYNSNIEYYEYEKSNGWLYSGSCYRHVIFKSPIFDKGGNLIEWSVDRKSQFIEHIILGLPIHLIILKQLDEFGNLEVVSTYNPLMTLYLFVNNNFKLKNLEVLTTLNSLRYEDLPEYVKKKIRDYLIHCIILPQGYRNESIIKDSCSMYF